MMFRLVMRSMRCDRSWNEEVRIVNWGGSDRPSHNLIADPLRFIDVDPSFTPPTSDRSEGRGRTAQKPVAVPLRGSPHLCYRL